MIMRKSFNLAASGTCIPSASLHLVKAP